MVGGETEVVGDALSADTDLKIFLHVKAYRLVSACGLSRVARRPSSKQSQAPVKQRFREQKGKSTFAGLSGKRHQGAEDAKGHSIISTANVGSDRFYRNPPPAVVFG